MGNPVIYVGSKTGRDGLGGAVMSSDSFDSDSKALRPGASRRSLSQKNYS